MHKPFEANVRSCCSQGATGGTVASDWVTDLDRYADPVLPWSRADNLLASGPKGPRSAHRAICDILGMSAGERAGHAPTGRACQWAEPLMERLRVTVENATSEDSSHGPVCPHCREPLRSNLRQEQVTPQQAADPGPEGAMTLTYCGRCGWTLHVAPARADGPAGHGLAAYEEVAAPADEQTLEGQFQLRCRELIGEIRSLGFNPNVWVDMINSLGAAGAAKRLLAEHHMLVVTPWLVRRGQPELTLEHEIGQPRWSRLFTDEERAEAARRQTRAGKTPHRRRGRLRARRGPRRSGF